MLRLFRAGFLVAVSLLAANSKLYLKDGSYQLVREYHVQTDRVRYYSVERSGWEEIPLELVDVKRTEAEIERRQSVQREEAETLAAEEKAEREQQRELERVPLETGVYAVAGADLKPIRQAESKIINNRRRSVLKVLAPGPLVSGKATIELDGERSSNLVGSDRPEFYIRLAAEERFGILHLTPKKGVRVVEKWTIVPVTQEILQEQKQVEIFRKQVDEGLYKIWPTEPLAPGEYAVVEYTEGKGNTQVWDFGYRPARP